MSKKRALSGLTAAVLLLAGGCGDDEDSSPTRVTTYTLTIINNTATEYVIWIDGDSDPDFDHSGVIAGNTSRDLSLRIFVEYHIRFALEGQNPQTTFAYETTVSSDGADREFSFGP